MDWEITGNNKVKMNKEIPIKVKNLLDKCLDTKNLGYNLIFFKFYKTKTYYYFRACKPKGLVEANSKGWFQGTMSKEIGFKITNENTSTKAIIGALPLIDLDNLADFFFFI